MIPPAPGPVPVRDVAMAARYVRFLGLDPDLARVQGAHFTVPAPSYDHLGIDFVYGASESPLTAEEWGDLSVALIRSVPTQLALLGPGYLETIATVVVEASACRAERLRLGGPADSLDELLRRFADEVAVARRDVPLDHGDMILPSSSFQLPDSARAVIPAAPCPVDALDALRAHGFSVVEDALPGRTNWGMLRHEDGAALMVRVVDGVVTKHELLEGPRALEPWSQFGHALTPDASLAVRLAAHPGLTVADALARVRETGLEVRSLFRLDAGTDRKSMFFIVDQRAPRRRQALLALVVGPSNEVYGRWLLEGPHAVDQLARLLRGATMERLGAAGELPDPSV